MKPIENHMIVDECWPEVKEPVERPDMLCPYCFEVVVRPDVCACRECQKNLEELNQ